MKDTEDLLEELIHQIEKFQAGDITLEEYLKNKHKVILEYKDAQRKPK